MDLVQRLGIHKIVNLETELVLKPSVMRNPKSKSCKEYRSQRSPGGGKIFDRLVKNFPSIKVAR